MTNKEKKNILNEIVERLKKNINVKEIIIFGSYTNDSIKQDSDLDMLVILDEEGVVKRSGEPYCTQCSRLALDQGIGTFTLWHEEGIRQYPTDFYNQLSYQNASKR